MRDDGYRRRCLAYVIKIILYRFQNHIIFELCECECVCVFEYVISLLHVQLFSLTLSHCLSFAHLPTSRHFIFLLHYKSLLFFLLGGMTFSDSTLFSTDFCFVLAFFFLSLLYYAKIFVRISFFCAVCCFSSFEKSKQFPCDCVHWTGSIFKGRQTHKTFTKWTLKCLVAT